MLEFLGHKVSAHNPFTLNIYAQTIPAHRIVRLASIPLFHIKGRYTVLISNTYNITPLSSPSEVRNLTIYKPLL